LPFLTFLFSLCVVGPNNFYLSFTNCVRGKMDFSLNCSQSFCFGFEHYSPMNHVLNSAILPKTFSLSPKKVLYGITLNQSIKGFKLGPLGSWAWNSWFPYNFQVWCYKITLGYLHWHHNSFVSTKKAVTTPPLHFLDQLIVCYPQSVYTLQWSAFNPT
jgi:hypothetical protein